MISKLARKLVENAIVPGPGVVHISTFPLMMTGGVLKGKKPKEALSGSATPQVLRAKP